VRIVGAGAKRTVIDAKEGDRVFQLGNQAQPGGEATISGLTMRNGHATDGGPGGAVSTSGALTLKRVLVRDSETNFAQGAIGLVGVDASLELIKSTVQGNNGGIYLSLMLAIADIRATTIAGNIAHPGAASNIQNNCCNNGYGVLNSIVADPFGGGVNCEGQAPISEANNLDDGATCNFDDTTSEELIDAELKPLAGNGGPTQTRAIRAVSPAKNAGDCVTSFPQDQRGFPRPRGPECDIGAFERGPSD